MGRAILDPKIMAKIAERSGRKNPSSVSVMISQKASKLGISSEAALIIIAKKHGIGTSVYQRSLDPAKQAEVRAAISTQLPATATVSVSRRPSLPSRSASKADLWTYVHAGRLQELRLIKSADFDLVKLIRLCEELSLAFSRKSYLSTIFLVRAVIDHVPPIFQAATFTEIVNNYRGSRSFKESMKNLESSSRKIADQYLHGQIRNSEVLPNENQVDFSNDIDVLLAEIYRILK